MANQEPHGTVTETVTVTHEETTRNNTLNPPQSKKKRRRNGNGHNSFHRMVYRPSPKLEKPTWPRIKKAFVTLTKIVITLLIPILPVVGAVLPTWYWGFYKPETFFPYREGFFLFLTATAAPTIVLIYVLLATTTFNGAWKELKTVKLSAKQKDLHTFMVYRDESVSPLVYTLITMFSLAILGACMGIEYPSFECGCLVVGVVSYLMTLFVFVLYQVDHPCSGIWFLNHIESKWRDYDADDYFAQYQAYCKVTHSKDEFSYELKYDED